MSKAEIAAERPFIVRVEEGRNYFWCACGKSASQPFCDGAHKGTGISPVRYTAEKSGEVYFCGCKQSGSAPLCDGSHKKLWTV